MPLSPNDCASRSIAGTSPRSSSAEGRSSTASRRTSWSVETTSSRSASDRLARLAARRVLERLQAEQDRRQCLAGLVVQLAREPLALELLRLHHSAHGVAAHALGEVDAGRGPGGQRLREPQVVVGEARIGPGPVVRHDDADRRAADHERNVEARVDAEPADRLLVDLGILEHRVDPLAPAALEDAAHLGVVEVELIPGNP